MVPAAVSVEGLCLQSAWRWPDVRKVGLYTLRGLPQRHALSDWCIQARLLLHMLNVAVCCHQMAAVPVGCGHMFAEHDCMGVRVLSCRSFGRSTHTVCLF